MNQSFTYINADGQSVECSVVAMLRNEGKEYVAYTDGSLDSDGSLMPFLEQFMIDETGVFLIPIEDDSEFQRVSLQLENLRGDFDEE